MTISPRVINLPWLERCCETSSPAPELEPGSPPCLVTWNGDGYSQGNGSGTCCCERACPLSPCLLPHHQQWLEQETCCETASTPSSPSNEICCDSSSGLETLTWNETGISSVIWYRNETDCDSCPCYDSCLWSGSGHENVNEILTLTDCTSQEKASVKSSQTVSK